MGRRWYGVREYGTIDSFGTFTDITFSLNLPAVHSGDTVLRLLCGFTLDTDLVDNSSGIQFPTIPVQVGFTYQPDPDGEPNFDPGGAGGAALFKDYARWQPQNWTDGTLYATRWHADSGGMISVQGQRIIHDKTTAEIHLIAKQEEGASPPAGVTWVFPTIYVGLWCEALIHQNF